LHDPVGKRSGYPSALRAVRTVLRRKWVVLASVAVATSAAIGFSSHQQTLYRASAQVLLKYQDLATGLTGIQNPSGVGQDPVRVAETQSQVAMSPAVARRVVERAKVPGLDAEGFLRVSAVSASANADILDFSTTYGNRTTAELLATLHAGQYIAYRQQLDSAALVAARKELAERIAELRARSSAESGLISRLVEDSQRLRTMEALQTANASLLRTATTAEKVQPKPVKAAVLGAVLGLLLGIGLAFAREALDSRVESAGDVEELLGLPLLARVTTPPRKLRRGNELTMLVNPNGADAEPFRILRTNVDFVNQDRGARSIMVTSGLEQEGKTTVVANLAVSFARAGRQVALVDLDLRRPSIARAFGIDGSRPGVTDVALERWTLDAALVGVSHTSANGGSTNGSYPLREPSANLQVLVAGNAHVDPGEFVNTSGLARVLDNLIDRFELVLIDTPPLLSLGDTIALSARVDAMIVVAQLGTVREPTLLELARVLDMCATVKLGCVATGAELEEGYPTFGYGYYGPRRHANASILEREKEGSIV
jgi:Mrp family chromosome partitioning ATPase/capsular polysaccharide biosynthesis protein